MQRGSEKLGVMQSSDLLENKMHENMRQLMILQSFALSHMIWGIHYVYCMKCTYTVVVYPFVCCVYCFVNAAASSCYYADLVAMPLYLSRNGWHNVEI